MKLAERMARIGVEGAFAVNMRARALEAKVWPLLASGKVKVVMDSTFPLAKAADAHRRLESGAHVGKVVLMV